MPEALVRPSLARRPLAARGRRWLATLLLATLPLGAAPGPPSPPAPPASGGDVTPIVVGSKEAAESRILAEIMAQTIAAHTGLPVRLADGLGGTLLVFSALRAGEIDLYPEYTGTGWSVVLQRTGTADPLTTYATVADAFRRQHDLHWLSPFGFSNSYALAVPRPLAEELGLRTISDLLPHASTLAAGFSHEFLRREDGWPGLAAAYGLSFASVRGIQHGLALAALENGDLQVVDAWTTDGKLLRYDVTVLEDDEGFFPPYHGAPLVRGELLARHPEVGDALALLAFRLGQARMQHLNAQVELHGHSFRDVARTFLLEEGLLEDDGRAVEAAAPGGRRGDLLAFVRSRVGVTLRLAGEHLLLTLAAVLAAIAVAVPLGIGLTRRPALARGVLGAAGVVQTIPSLALLAALLPLLGLGAAPALVALFLYALLPIVRNTTTGIREVDPDLVKAARGMGLTDGQVLRLVELPLATHTIMAGVRTATVISIGVATLAAFVGAGGLGEPIVTGLALDSPRLVLAGALPAAALAIVVDLLLERVETALSPSRASRPAFAMHEEPLPARAAPAAPGVHPGIPRRPARQAPP